MLFILMVMQSISDHPLQGHNSFNIKASCSRIYFPASLADLQQLPDLSAEKFYILGEGSNTLFVESQAPVIIQPNFTGMTVTQENDYFTVTAGAAENWHNLVEFCLAQGIYGLENLALIPGSVGAAPVQNIGAYGVDFSDYCLEVHWYDFANKTTQKLSKQACLFGYRDSIFKQALYNKGLITHVTLKFPKKWQANLSYAGLDVLAKDCSAKEVMARVIMLRSTKLPDPDKLPNAGSFFKNPVVSNKLFTQLQQAYPDMPYYPQQNGKVKLAAAWLIEQAGLKGFRHQGVGVHEKQALVLVNYSSESGNDIVSLAKYIQQQVKQKFTVVLTPEVRLISHEGEKTFKSLCDYHAINLSDKGVNDD